MRTPITSLLILAALLHACQLKAPGAAAGKRPVPTAAQPAASSRPAPVPSGTILSGLVQIDAHYVVAAGGGNVVAVGGGNVVAVGGGNVVAPGGGNFRLLGIDVPLGQLLPARGMRIEARSMLTGRPFGEAVASDERGGFRVGVPQGTTDNVLLVASIPGSTDARLLYPLVVSPAIGSGHQIDEDTATVTRYVRRCMVTLFASRMTAEGMAGDAADFLQLLKIPPEAAIVVTPAFNDFRAACRDRGTDQLSPAERDAVAQRLTDVLLAKVALAEVAIDPQLYSGNAEAEPAIPALVDVMRQMRAGATARMTADRAYFSKQDFVQQARRPWAIKKPTDLADFVVEEYLSRTDEGTVDALGVVWTNIGLPEPQIKRFQRAGDAISLAIAKVFAFDKASRDLALEAIRTAQPD